MPKLSPFRRAILAKIRQENDACQLLVASHNTVSWEWILLDSLLLSDRLGAAEDCSSDIFRKLFFWRKILKLHNNRAVKLDSLQKIWAYIRTNSLSGLNTHKQWRKRTLPRMLRNKNRDSKKVQFLRFISLQSQQRNKNITVKILHK